MEKDLFEIISEKIRRVKGTSIVLSIYVGLILLEISALAFYIYKEKSTALTLNTLGYSVGLFILLTICYAIITILVGRVQNKPYDILVMKMFKEKFVEVANTFEDMKEGYDPLFFFLHNSDKVWQIDHANKVTNFEGRYHSNVGILLNRWRSSFDEGFPPYMRFDVPMYELKLMSEIIYFCPFFIIEFDRASKTLRPVWYMNVKEFNFSIKIFTEEPRDTPSDAQIVGQVWRYINKDGTRDLRFKNNYLRNQCSYLVMTLRYEDKVREIYFSNTGTENHKELPRLMNALLEVHQHLKLDFSLTVPKKGG